MPSQDAAGRRGPQLDRPPVGNFAGHFARESGGDTLFVFNRLQNKF